ncbi:hypothetical protein TNCV_4574791 [Trichonephila clavipes]|nr:hypothetical protein TNCV_4574791 [Trichonephila clavipes]
MRACGDGPRNFEPWSSDDDDTRAGTHLLSTTFELSTDLTGIAPYTANLRGTGLELMTCQPRPDTLTTRLPRPLNSILRVFSDTRTRTHDVKHEFVHGTTGNLRDRL